MANQIINSGALPPAEAAAMGAKVMRPDDLATSVVLTNDMIAIGYDLANEIGPIGDGGCKPDWLERVYNAMRALEPARSPTEALDRADALLLAARSKYGSGLTDYSRDFAGILAVLILLSRQSQA